MVTVRLVSESEKMLAPGAAASQNAGAEMVNSSILPGKARLSAPMHPDKTRKKVTNACRTNMRSARIASEPILSKPTSLVFERKQQPVLVFERKQQPQNVSTAVGGYCRFVFLIKVSC